MSKAKRLTANSEAEKRRMKAQYLDVVDGFRKTLKSLYKD